MHEIEKVEGAARLCKGRPVQKESRYIFLRACHRGIIKYKSEKRIEGNGDHRERAYFFGCVGGDLTLFDSQARPSSSPSPVVAQLGTTYQILSFRVLSFSMSVTSCGFIATVR